MKHLLFSILIFVLYFVENIARNVFVNILGMSSLIGTLLAVIIFSAVILVITKFVPIESSLNSATGNTVVIYLATAALILINLYPFDIKTGKDIWGMIVQLIFVAAVEELIFRGYLFRFFATVKNYKTAIILTSLLFGLVHITNLFNDNWLLVLLQIIGAIGIGVIYSVTYYKTGNLYLCIISHALINISANIGTTDSLAKESVFTVACVLLSLVLLLCLLAGCSGAVHPSAPPVPNQQETSPSEATIPQTEVPTETLPTEPEHSDLYIPGVSAEDVILYFNEVCLDSEFVNGGDPSYIQKWTDPIYYTLYGEYTDEDLSTLSSFVNWLNAIEGFPGICEAQVPEDANLRIHFCSQTEMIDLMGDKFWGTDGAVTFWYMFDEIYDAVICYRTDLDQHLRNSVILEEIYNGLGPIQDTALRPDSIIYSEFSQPQWLSPVDELLLRLLYHPDIRPGMNTQQCEQVIRSIYY